MNAAALEDTWDFAAEARQRLLGATHGTLCTIAAQREIAGFPFGSVVPYALDPAGRPVVLLARIAAHTANLLGDPRATLFVSDDAPHGDGDPQSTWRIGLMGRFVPLCAPSRAHKPLPGARVVDDATLIDLMARYRARVPDAEGYEDTHRFDYWLMDDVARGRYIGGFGKIRWIEAAGMLRDPMSDGIADAAPGAIEHMNEDHPHNLIEMVQGLHGFTPAEARMVALDRAGFSVETDQRRVYFEFGREITADELRGAVIEVLKKARARMPVSGG